MVFPHDLSGAVVGHPTAPPVGLSSNIVFWALGRQRAYRSLYMVYRYLEALLGVAQPLPTYAQIGRDLDLRREHVGDALDLLGQLGLVQLVVTEGRRDAVIAQHLDEPTRALLRNVARGRVVLDLRTRTLHDATGALVEPQPMSAPALMEECSSTHGGVLQHSSLETLGEPGPEVSASSPRGYENCGIEDAAVYRKTLPNLVLQDVVLSSSGVTPDIAVVIQQPEPTPKRKRRSKEAIENERAGTTESLAPQVREVFDYWKLVTKQDPRVTLTAQRRTKIEARLREGRTVDDLKAVADHVMKIPFYRGENPSGRPYLDVVTIYKNATKVEELLLEALRGENPATRRRTIPGGDRRALEMDHTRPDTTYEEF